MYNWVDPNSMLDIDFRDWRRNSDVSERDYLVAEFRDNGDNCVHMVAWQEDPLIEEQGSFDEVPCNSQKAFVCQVYADSVRHSLIVEGTALLEGGRMIGGRLEVFGQMIISDFTADGRAVIVAHESAEATTVSKLILNDGSTWHVDTDVIAVNTSFVGETSTIGMQPKLLLYPGRSFAAHSIGDTNSSTIINARLETASNSSLIVHGTHQLVLKQGGDLSSSRIALNDRSSDLILDGYASRLVTYDAFELKLTHRYCLLMAMYFFNLLQ